MSRIRNLVDRLNRPVIIPLWLLTLMVVVILLDGARYFHE